MNLPQSGLKWRYRHCFSTYFYIFPKVFRNNGIAQNLWRNRISTYTNVYHWEKKKSKILLPTNLISVYNKARITELYLLDEYI
jgi:hypothetical protein